MSEINETFTEAVDVTTQSDGAFIGTLEIDTPRPGRALGQRTGRLARSLGPRGAGAARRTGGLGAPRVKSRLQLQVPVGAPWRRPTDAAILFSSSTMEDTLASSYIGFDANTNTGTVWSPRRWTRTDALHPCHDPTTKRPNSSQGTFLVRRRDDAHAISPHRHAHD